MFFNVQRSCRGPFPYPARATAFVGTSLFVDISDRQTVGSPALGAMRLRRHLPRCLSPQGRTHCWRIAV